MQAARGEGHGRHHSPQQSHPHWGPPSSDRGGRSGSRSPYRSHHIEYRGPPSAHHRPGQVQVSLEVLQSLMQAFVQPGHVHRNGGGGHTGGQFNGNHGPYGNATPAQDKGPEIILDRVGPPEVPRAQHWRRPLAAPTPLHRRELLAIDPDRST